MTRPNVVYCFCDQMRPFELGCYGGDFVRTPNLDALAGRSVRLETACSNSTLCTPARSTLLTGQHTRTCTGSLGCCAEPIDTRPVLPDPTIAETLREAGYRTSLIGKWHVLPRPEMCGFDEVIYPRVPHVNRDRIYYGHDRREFVVEGDSHEYEMARVADFLAREHRDPFFLFWSISLPHMPYFDVPRRYRTMYDPAAVPLRPNVPQNSQSEHDEHWFRIYYYDYLHYKENRPDCQDLPEGFDVRMLNAMYFGMISCVDDQVGHLMAQLPANGLDENTIVVFTSDHGDNLGSHGRYNKNCNAEEAIRIPMMISQPGRIEPRTVTKQISSLVDVTPTTLSMLDIEPGSHVQGTDLTPVLLGRAETTGENVAYLESVAGEVGVRTTSHKYGVATNHREVEVARYESSDGTTDLARTITDEADQFFDLRDDPYELNNLAKTDQQADLAKSLRRKTLAWNEQTPWLGE